MSGDTIALAVAAVLLAAAVLSAVRRRASGRRRLAAGLRSVDPGIRIAALEEVDHDGVAAHAPQLLRHLDTERDPAVLDAIERLVRRDQWEPVVHRAQAALRAWADERTEPAPRPVPFDGTVLAELDDILGARARVVTITRGGERLVVLRGDGAVDRPSGKRWRR